MNLLFHFLHVNLLWGIRSLLRSFTVIVALARKWQDTVQVPASRTTKYIVVHLVAESGLLNTKQAYSSYLVRGQKKPIWHYAAIKLSFGFAI